MTCMNVNNLWYKYGEINISACQRDEDENLLCHVCLSEEKQKLWLLLDGARKKLSIILYWKCHNFFEVQNIYTNIWRQQSLNESRMQCCGYAQSRYVMPKHKIFNNLVVDQKDNLHATYSRDVEPSQIRVGEK